MKHYDRKRGVQGSSFPETVVNGILGVKKQSIYTTKVRDRISGKTGYGAGSSRSDADAKAWKKLWR